MIFDKIKVRKPKLSNFDLSHEKKLSLQMGRLVPVFLEEVVPGDRFKVNSEIMMRMAPMISPVMHRVNLYMHYFFVPNRLLWDEWENFITGGEDGSEDPAFPYMELNNTYKAQYQPGLLPDYLGLPVIDQGDTVSGAIQHSALPFRAYQLIYNEYYRDQNLQSKVPITKDSVVQSAELSQLYYLRYRNWEKDYLTSSLPWTQRGGDVNLPIEAEFTPDYLAEASFQTASSGTGNLSVDSQGYVQNDGVAQRGQMVNLENPQTVDTSTVTINDLRLAIRLQEWLEKNARAGSRYIEQILSHFGVKSSDSRLQRPEYLGGGRQPIVISEVLNTVGTFSDGSGETGNPQGTMSGHGLSVGNTPSFKRSFEEHGVVMGIMSVLPRTAYQDGIPRFHRKMDKFDFYWPSFAHLGEQEVLQSEVYYHPLSVSYNNAVFGYQSRYSEYKYKPSSVHGEMKDTLDHWHMGRKLTSSVALNTNFITADPTQRIFADTDEDVHKLYCQIYHRFKALRPMPYFGTPRL